LIQADSLLSDIQDLEVEKAEVEVDREQVMHEMREGKKEQEDLLVLLADQDTKLKTYRRRLKELGEKVMLGFLLLQVLHFSTEITAFGN